MMKHFSIVAALAALLFATPALAQTNPNLITGQVLTAAQWNALFASKQDTLGYTPLNTAGGVMTGPMVTAPSSSVQAGFNIPPGTAPGTPSNGDIWGTASGLFARVNGATFNLISGASICPLCAQTNVPNTFTATQTFPNNSLTLAEFPTIGANTVIGSIAGGTPAALTTTQITTLVNTFTTTLNGAVTAPGSVSGRFLGDDGAWHTSSGSGTVTSAAYTNSTGMAITGTTPCTVTCSWTFAIDKATASNYEAGTSNKVLTADNVYTAEVGITPGASVTFDFSTFLNGAMTLSANVTSLTCSNMKAGQSGQIRIAQDATGSRTMVSTWCSAFSWAGGVKGVLTTTPSTVDVLIYSCWNSTTCLVSLSKAISFLLERDINPASNDNYPAFMMKVG